MSLGDRITLTVEVEHASSETVTWPALTDTLGSFELVEARSAAPIATDGRQTSIMQYELTTFELGDLEIPAVEVTVADSGDSEPQLLRTEPISVSVESVGIDETGDIRAVKDPLEIPRNWLLLLPWVLLICGSAALSYWIYRRYRARERPLGQPLVSATPPRPPHEIAHEALDRLEDKRLLERGETKQYFIEVSEILRTYLEARYPIDALEMDSHEVLDELKRVGLEPEVFDLFPPFFNRADLVKFAKHRPNMETSRDMIPMARLLVDETKATDGSQYSERGVEVDELATASNRVEVS
jgi:hypothetical protein